MLKYVKSKLKKTNCHICGGEKIQILTQHKELAITKNYEFEFNCFISVCTICGFVFAHKIPNNDFLFRYYSDAHIRKSSLVDISNHFDRNSRLETVKKYVEKTAKILEIGANDGQFTGLLNDSGYVAKGLDPLNSDSPNVKGNIFLGKQKVIKKKKKENYDCVACYYVLEHVRNPSEWIGFIKLHLKQGGILILEVPNYYAYPEESLMFEHLQHFTPIHMKFFLESNGFKVLSCNKEKPSRYFGFTTVARYQPISINSIKSPIKLSDLKDCVGFSKKIFRKYQQIKESNEKFDERTTKQILSIVKSTSGDVFFWAANEYASRLNKKLAKLIDCKANIVDSADTKIGAFHETFENKILSPQKIPYDDQMKIFVVCSPNYYNSIRKQINDMKFKKFRIINGYGKNNNAKKPITAKIFLN